MKYIQTSDGKIGVVTNSTKNFIDTCVDFGKHKLNLRFSKVTYKQRGTPNRCFYWLNENDYNEKMKCLCSICGDINNLCEHKVDLTD